MTATVLGRYVPYDTPIHRLDPRNKIIGLILIMVGIFLPYISWTTTFIMLGLLFIFIIALMIIARVSFIQLFKSMKTMWFLVIFLVIINVLVPAYGTEHPAFYIGTFAIYWESIMQSGKIVLRLIMMLSLTMVLTSSTKPLDLTYGLEWFMLPLKVIHFPAHEIAMTISIALRFIPTLLDETDRIMKAQASRGVDFGHGKIGARFKSIISLIIPLFISAFQRSEELANAMEARGYDPRAKRTRFRVLHFHISDLVAFVVYGGVFAAILYMTITKTDIISSIWGITTLVGVII